MRLFSLVKLQTDQIRTGKVVFQRNVKFQVFQAEYLEP